MASEPTRGPVVVRRHKHRDMTEYPCLHVVAAEGDGERVILSKIDTSDSDLFANFDLIAAAFNSATAAADLGFDPIGAIEALPELLKALTRCRDLPSPTIREVLEMGDKAIDAYGLNPWCVNEGLATGFERVEPAFIDLALSAARKRKGVGDA